MRKRACLCPGRQGFAIILVLAVLVLLAMLSLTYIKLALIDRNIARNYMDNKRAKLIAQSGVEYALARVQEDPFGTTWQELLSKVIKINGIDTKYTESSGSTYGENRDIFKVTVKDCNSMINVNDGLGNERVTANTKRILNVLGDVAGVATLGDKIINARPPNGYGNKNELIRVLGNADFDRVKDLVTTHAWQDPNVANPVPLSGEVISAYPVSYNTGLNTPLGSISIYRYGRGYETHGLLIHNPPTKNNPLLFAPDLADGNSLRHAIYALDELNPQWIEIISRSPVNINTAQGEVLIALLKDLKGFFISDRRRNCPDYKKSYSILDDYAPHTQWQQYHFDYSPAKPIGDELGFLYTTDQINAATIADEIINCRNNIGTYATEWFGGQFKTWRQFNAFCDNLVEGILKETRGSIFYGEVARRHASQAMADCLKANFNPNLHLNESNPDANIKTLVDKTDLIVNSTEFCFSPMGYFQIESEGFILKAKGSDNVVIANSKVEAVVKSYDAYRETNQKQFLAGILVEAKSLTNNGRALEIGPEPATADLTSAIQNEWGGYIALSTVSTRDSVFVRFRANFSKDFNAAYHVDGDSYQPNLTTYNLADRTESGPGSYVYNSNYRLARSFRRETQINTLRAPADLRIDGAYVERHAGLAYDRGTTLFQTRGMVYYWIKPSFYPEITGKPRTFFSLSRGNWSPYLDLSDIFANFFLPSHWPDSESASETATIQYTSAYAGLAYRGTSLIFGYKAHLNPEAGGIGHSTPFLNHLSHFDSSGDPRSCHPSGSAPKPNYLRSGQWTHVACAWNLPPSTPPSSAEPENYAQIWINGAKLSNSCSIFAHPLNGRTLVGSGPLRIGEPTYTKNWNCMLHPASTDDWIHNWTCDSTVDEVVIGELCVDSSGKPYPDITLMWTGVYTDGRYCKSSETSYISGILDLTEQTESPSCSTIQSPSASGVGGNVSPAMTKVIGISWTWYAEDTDTVTVTKKGKAIVRNYKDFKPPDDPATFIYPEVRASVLKNYNPLTGTSETEYKPVVFDEGYSSLYVEISPAAQYRYKVTFNINITNPLNTVLLTTPVFDDITIYYTNGVKFLSYSNFE